MVSFCHLFVKCEFPAFAKTRLAVAEIVVHATEKLLKTQTQFQRKGFELMNSLIGAQTENECAYTISFKSNTRELLIG